MDMESHKDDEESGVCHLKRGCKEDGTTLFLVVSSTRTKAIATHSNTGGVIWTSGSTSLLCEWHSTGTVCPEWLWSLPPWRSSKATWTWSWATCSRCPFLSRKVGPDDFQKSLPTSTFLQFCNTEDCTSCMNVQHHNKMSSVKQNMPTFSWIFIRRSTFINKIKIVIFIENSVTYVPEKPTNYRNAK